MDTPMGQSTVGEMLPILIGLFFGVLFLAFCIKMFISTSKTQKTIKSNNHEKLIADNFNVSKEIIINIMVGLTEKLLIDDVNKKFAIVNYLGCNIYNYSDLLAFELNEDGEVITSGKGLQTVIGGATFGVVGALVGGSGKRKSNSTCRYMKVRILLNNLQNPQTELTLINREVKKKSMQYTIAKSKGDEITATLNYINNYNKSNAVSTSAEINL